MRDAGENLEGWKQVVDSPIGSIWMKTAENGDTLARITHKIELPAEICLMMYTDPSPEACDYTPNVKSKKCIKDWGPDDKVWLYHLELNWALRYIMGFPEILPLHVVKKEDYPEKGSYSYTCVPYDVEKNINLETLGPYRADTGCFTPDPQDPMKCTYTQISRMDMKLMPEFAQIKTLQSQCLEMTRNLVNGYKKHPLHEKHTAIWKAKQ
jgi:hypothetical protein